MTAFLLKMSRNELVNEVEMLVKGEAEKGAYHHVIELLFQENVSVTVLVAVSISFVILPLNHTPSVVTTLNMKFLKPRKISKRTLQEVKNIPA